MAVDVNKRSGTRRRHVTFVGFALCALFAAANVSAGKVQLEILLSSNGGEYQELVSAFTSELSRHCIRRCRDQPTLTVSTIGTWDQLAAPDLLIALGNKAAVHALVGKPRQSLYGLIPRTTWESLTRLYPDPDQNRNAVYLDQPLDRQFDLIALTLPAHKLRVGVLLGPESAALAPALQDQAASHGVELVVEQVLTSDEVGPAVERLSTRIDVLLAVPDAEVFNRDTLYGILLTSYGARVPVVGYSAGLVRAGAMIAVYTPIDAIARDLARATADFVADGHLPASGPSQDFSVAINQNVARSLGYELPDSVALEAQLEALEDGDAAAQAAQ